MLFLILCLGADIEQKKALAFHRFIDQVFGIFRVNFCVDRLHCTPAWIYSLLRRRISIHRFRLRGGQNHPNTSTQPLCVCHSRFIGGKIALTVNKEGHWQPGGSKRTRHLKIQVIIIDRKILPPILRKKVRSHRPRLTHIEHNKLHALPVFLINL